MSYLMNQRKPKDTYFHIIHQQVEYIVDKYGEITSVDRHKVIKKRPELMYSENEPLSQVENFAYLVQEFSEETDEPLQVWFHDCSVDKMEADFDRRVDEEIDRRRDLELENEV